MEAYYFGELLTLLLGSEEVDLQRAAAAFQERLKRKWNFSTSGSSHAARSAFMKLAKELSGEELDNVRKLYSMVGLHHKAMKELRDYRWWKRSAAVSELRTMRNLESLEDILLLLSDADEMLKVQAFEAGLDIGGFEILPFMIESLPEITLLTAMGLETIILAQDGHAADFIMPILNIKGDNSRKFAIQMLGILRWIPAVPTLIQITTGEKADESVYALLSLSAIGDPRAVHAGLKALTSKSWQIRACGILLLGELGDPQGLPLLAAMLGDSSREVRLHAGYALTKFGKEGLSILSKATNSDLPGTRAAATEVMDNFNIGIAQRVLEFQW